MGWTLLTAMTSAVALAGEADPAHGYRIHSAAPTNRASTRLVLVRGPTRVFQQAPRLRLSTRRWSGDAQLVLMQASSSTVDWSEFRVGQTLVGGRLHLGKKRNHAILVEVGLAFGDGGDAWGSHSVETSPGHKELVGWEMDQGLGPVDLTVRVAAGWEEQENYPYGVFFEGDMEAGLVAAVPIASSGAWLVLTELEWQGKDHIPVGSRLWVRWSPDAARAWSLDLGGQAAIATGHGIAHAWAGIGQVGYGF